MHYLWLNCSRPVLQHQDCASLQITSESQPHAMRRNARVSNMVYEE